MPEAPGLFEIIEIRASGAYAAVCLAKRRDDPLQRLLGLKVLRATLINSPQILTRTRDEARVLSKLNHPNIVKVEELLGIQRRPVMVMEWVSGVSMRELLDHNREGVPVSVALEAISRAARALQAAHEARDADGTPMAIIHRDIKPANLLLSEHGQIKIVDFGLSRGEYYERETTTITTLLGSMGYMAPERFGGDANDSPAVDIYSLGITLAELICGKLAILPREEDVHPQSLARYLRRICPPELDEARQEMLRDLIGAMCNVDPAARPDNDEVRQRIHMIQRQGKLRTDLSEYAITEVAPLYNERPRLPPRSHPAWEDVAFLEEADLAPEPMLHETTDPGSEAFVAKADRRVRDFLSNDDWASKKRELKWLLALHPQWNPAPFVEILERATQPWWRFWSRPPHHDQLAVSLEVLKHRVSPELVVLAEALVDHADERVRAAAQVVLDHHERREP